MKRKINFVALIIIFAVSVNCGLIGIFRFDVITWLFNGPEAAISRIIYVLVAAAGLWCVNLIAAQGRINQLIRYTAPDPMRNMYSAPDNVYSKYAAPGPMPKSNPKPQNDKPAGETVCSPHFSQGCINKEPDSVEISKKGV